MQNSSEFQYIAIDQIFESTTNPRQTFDQAKLEELAESIRQNDVIQPVVVRPKDGRFELVVGARRFRASQLAEKFSIPARIKELTDAQVIEWQLLENSQRVDIHPYEEAQGFDRLLQLPGYDVASIVAKSGKSASHIYGRLSLLQLIPSVAEAFVAERITVSHANLIARLPAEHQALAFENCWRKDWQDSEAHLLPAKHLGAWIQTHLYLSLTEAPFDREDATLVPEAGSCVSCPKRSGYNTSLFADVDGDQCLSPSCFHLKVSAHIDRQIDARPELVQIETSWRAAKEQRPGALNRNQFCELDTPDNPDAESPCSHTRSAIVVFGRQLGHILTVCVEPNDCPVHNPDAVPEEDIDPAPSLPPAPPEETEEEAAIRIATHEQQVAAFEAERQQREAERQAVQQRQREEYEAERTRREELRQQREATFETILARVPPTFDPVQMRFFLRLLIQINAYDFLEEVAARLAGNDESEQTDEEVVLAALNEVADASLTQFALQLALTERVAIPQVGETDWLEEASSVFPIAEVVETASQQPRKRSSAKGKPSQSVRKNAA